MSSRVATAHTWLICLSVVLAGVITPLAHAATELVNMTFDNGTPPGSPTGTVAVANDGTALDPNYYLAIPEIWNVALPANPFVDIDGRKAVKLSNSQMVEFDRQTTLNVVSNDVLRLSMDFKVDRLGKQPNGRPEGVVLFSMQNYFTAASTSNPDLAWAGFRLMMAGDGTGRVTLLASDGLGKRRHYSLFSDVPYDTWYRLNMMLDINQGVLTANLGDRYFQLSLFGPFAGGIDWSNVLKSITDNDDIQMRLGWGFYPNDAYMGGYRDAVIGRVRNQGQSHEGVMYFDNVIVHNAAPNFDHADFKTAVDSISKGITDTSLDLTSDYLDFLEYMVFALTSHYLSENTTEVNTYLQAYETAKPPLFSDRDYNKQLHTYPIVDRVMVILQHDIVVSHFNNNDLSDVYNIEFESREVFPGLVAGVEHVVASTDADVGINGSYKEFPGITRGSPAHRPTGYWAVAGHKVRVCVEGSVDTSGMDVIVGAHPPINLSRKINRNYSIVTGFPFADNTTDCVDVANPYGGGIYVRVHEGVDEGFVNVALSGKIVESPFFDNRIASNRPSGKAKTSNRDWMRMFRKSALPPWSDLESDNFMMTVPSNAAILVPRPRAALDGWDDMYDAVSVFQGRVDRPRAEYLVVDSTSFCGGCSGYWMTLPQNSALEPVSSRQNNGSWVYSHGLAPFNLLDDPNFSSARRFDHFLHEKGHNLKHPTLGHGNEEEAKANIIKLVGRTEVLGDTMDDALRYHNPQGLTIEQAVMDWIISDDFIDPALGSMSSRAYQSRPMVKYIDLAELFNGWATVGNIMKEFYATNVDSVPWPGFEKHLVKDQDFAEMAVEAFNNAGLDNPLPLLEFHGVVPTQATRDKAAITYGLGASSAILTRLNEYKALVPETKAEFASKYYELITHRSQIVLKNRFLDAKDNWETKTVAGRVGVTGYHDLIEARIDEIIATYGLNSP